jgi:hypothetical protein
MAKPIDKQEAISIFEQGQDVSGGWGFWRSRNLLNNVSPMTMVRAWVDGLREMGLSDCDIVFYGDWTDGRHIADNIRRTTTYGDFKKDVKESAKYRTKEFIQSENDKSYDYDKCSRILTIMLGDNYRKRK